MTSIFISYRRTDSMAYTGRIYDRLVNAFGARQVFKDVEDIPPGEDFRSVLDKALTAADVVLIIIGPQWVMISDDEGKRRLNDPNDFVRIEVETALKRSDVLVVPILVNNAAMPSADSLPAGLKDLSFRNSVVVRNDPDFNPDINNLITAIEKRVKGSGSQIPLIAGVIAVVLLIAALLVFVVLPALNPSTATATPTVQAVLAATTAAPTVKPTDLPTTVPTDKPTVAPTTEPTVAATATTAVVEATAEATEAVSADDLTPTVLYPTGRLLQLLYNDSSFYVYNAGSGASATIAFSSLKFEALDAAGAALGISFNGSRWSTVAANLTAQGCGALEPVQFRQFLHPATCKSFNSNRSNVKSSEYFWRTASGGDTFRVLWNNDEVARCPVTAGSNKCAVHIPPA